MSQTEDRVRRILSDHGAVVRRAAEVPAPSTDVRSRLDALRAAAVADRGRRAFTPRLPAAPVPVELPEEDGRTLADRVGGEVRENRYGSFLQVERSWRAEDPHGDVPLAEALVRPLPLRRRERRAGGVASIGARDAAFLDVETTGLSGGTGTIAFLVGVGRFTGDRFVVRQYFLRDFPDEPAVLLALAEDLGDAPLVTFNGRCFDAPLLATRFAIHRIPFPDRDHLDLLPPARRLWAGSLPSHALGEIERRVLKVARTEDLPGALMPAAYFAWLREARSAGLALAFRHNEVDIVSLAALAGVVSRVLDAPDSRPTAPARDHLHTAHLLVDQGDVVKARACLEAALDRAAADTATPALRRLLGTICRRSGDTVAAVRAWRRWIADDDAFDPHPYEEIAKDLEHRRRDVAGALVVVEQALARCPAGDARRALLEHRSARLRRRARPVER